MIRPAVEADVPELVAMIRELAEFENLADQVSITEDDLADALFGPEAMAHDWVVEDGNGGLAGHAPVVPDVLDLPGQDRDLAGGPLRPAGAPPPGPRQPAARPSCARRPRAAWNGRCSSGTCRPWTSTSGWAPGPWPGWTRYRWFEG